MPEAAEERVVLLRVEGAEKIKAAYDEVSRAAEESMKRQAKASAEAKAKAAAEVAAARETANAAKASEREKANAAKQSEAEKTKATKDAARERAREEARATAAAAKAKRDMDRAEEAGYREAARRARRAREQDAREEARVQAKIEKERANSFSANMSAAGRMGVTALRWVGREALAIARHILMVSSAVATVFTVYAVQQAIQREQIMAALTAIMGSATAAQEHFRELQKLSLLPGVTLDAALQTSQRLQAVGISAKVAADAVREFGNAAALSGAGADSMNRATVQLAQMVGKGKIMAEDIRVIAESMPTINRVLQETFGTSSAEKIAAMGYSAKQFVAIIVEGFQRLPRAGNTFANTMVNMKMAFQELAIAFGKGFIGIEGKDAVDALAKAFERLRPAAELAGKWVAQVMKDIAKALQDRAATTALAEFVLSFGLGIAQVITAMRQMDLQVRKLMTNIAGAWSVVMALINTPVDPKNPTAVWDAMARAWRKWGQAAREFENEQEKIDEGYQQMDAAARKAAAAVKQVGDAGAKAGEAMDEVAKATKDAAAATSSAAQAADGATESARTETDVMGRLVGELMRLVGYRLANYAAGRQQAQQTQQETQATVMQSGAMGLLMQQFQRLTGIRAAETAGINANTAAIRSNNRARDEADDQIRRAADTARRNAAARASRYASGMEAEVGAREATTGEWARQEEARLHRENVRQAERNVDRLAALAKEARPVGTDRASKVAAETARLDGAMVFSTANMERRKARLENEIKSLRESAAAEENEANKEAIKGDLAKKQTELSNVTALLESYQKAAEARKQWRAQEQAEIQRDVDARLAGEKKVKDARDEYERKRREVFGKSLREQAQEFDALREKFRQAWQDYQLLRNADTRQNLIDAGRAIGQAGGAIDANGRITPPREVVIGGMQAFAAGLKNGLKEGMKEAAAETPRSVNLSITGTEQRRQEGMNANDRITQAYLGSMGAGDDAILAQAKLNQEADLIRSTVYSGATSITKIITQSMADGFAEAREETKAMVARFMGQMVGSAA